MINLCDLLKGHEGEVFYSPVFGNTIFSGIINYYDTSLIKLNVDFYLDSSGRLNSYNGECILFPSREQRDWNKWAEEQKPKTPKTWNELVKQGKNKWLS